MSDTASVSSKVTLSTNSSTHSVSVLDNNLEVPSVIGPPPPPDTKHRAVHQVRLKTLTHNYNCVEAVANRQKCSVIVVVKADGYGHGAIATAIHLADTAGADCFAVATLEEAISLRKAFEATPPGGLRKVVAASAAKVAALFKPPDQPDAPPEPAESTVVTTKTTEPPKMSRRAPFIRILVLGPPVGHPRCFDDYYYYGIEVMVSGPEVAKALMEWVDDADARKRTLVERHAMEAKARALSAVPGPRDEGEKPPGVGPPNGAPKPTAAATASTENQPKPVAQGAATLSNVSGHDLAKEVRSILMNQEAAKNKAQPNSVANSGKNSPVPTTASKDSKVSIHSSNGSSNKKALSAPDTFGGIEAVASTSRNREKATKAKEIFMEDASEVSSLSMSLQSKATLYAGARARRKLRWHALVDSGMGRLGFKTEPVMKGDNSGRRDTVAIINDMVDAELHADAPIEFFGMCTHMAEAHADSDYTTSQIAKFKGLLKRVRDANISVPTVSTDNSAALLTTTLTHFDPDELLSQPHVHTRGFVRIGGAIYGQRPAFKQLRAVSTLKAAVRHVAILQKGDSVGYDRAYIAPRNVRIATLTAGFADGYPRELGNKVGSVAIRGQLFPVAGNVCMDMMMVELGPAEDTDGVGAQVTVGDVAILWGPADEEDGEGLVRLQDIAMKLKTTQSALTCGLDKIRVPRELIP